jgi:anti-anti-sigma regulatory factor
METGPSIHVVDQDAGHGRARLILSGWVTVANAGDFHRAALSLCERGGHVGVDCSAAEHLDTSAVQLLLALGAEVERRGYTCEVVGASPAVRETLRLAGYVGRRGSDSSPTPVCS